MRASILKREYDLKKDCHYVQVKFENGSADGIKTLLYGELLSDDEAVERAANLEKYPRQGFVYRNLQIVSTT